jgi:hypothetical protein
MLTFAARWPNAGGDVYSTVTVRGADALDADQAGSRRIAGFDPDQG